MSVDRPGELAESAGCRIVLVGAPGSGKTTSAVRRYRDLVTAARDDESRPVPVFLRLGGWAGGTTDLAGWIVDALVDDFGITERDAKQALMRIVPVLVVGGVAGTVVAPPFVVFAFLPNLGPGIAWAAGFLPGRAARMVRRSAIYVLLGALLAASLWFVDPSPVTVMLLTVVSVIVAALPRAEETPHADAVRGRTASPWSGAPGSSPSPISSVSRSCWWPPTGSSSAPT